MKTDKSIPKVLAEMKVALKISKSKRMKKQDLENKILKFALEEALELIAVGYGIVKKKKNKYGYLEERRTYDAIAERFFKLAKKDFREELREHYNKKKEE